MQVVYAINVEAIHEIIDTVACQRAMYNGWHTVGIQKMFEFESSDLGKSSLARGISHQLPAE